MSLQACADLVAKADPDRYLATMAAPVAAREKLFPIYAFNVEVARAPWVTLEPMIAEMRLQWWRDALDEIRFGKKVRKHEVVTVLADVISPEVAEVLDKVVQARRWDVYNFAFEDEDHFADYIAATGGGLTWAVARALGADQHAEAIVRRFGSASALVKFLAAVPELEERGRQPLLDGSTAAITRLAEQHLDALPDRKALKKCLQANEFSAVLEGWQTRLLLMQIAREPMRVSENSIGLSPFRKRLGLLRWA